MQKTKLTELFKTRTRAAWCALLEHTDACFAPVLSMHEAPHHPHNQARSVFVQVGAMVQPAPAPRYSATPSATPLPAASAGADAAALLAELGYEEARIAR